MTDITKACEAFWVLLEEQQTRVANASEEKKDFSQMKTVTIGIIDGDGYVNPTSILKATV